MSGKIVKVSGPVAVAEGLYGARLADAVRIGKDGGLGEILTINGGSAAIQVYGGDEPALLGAEVISTGAPLCVELGPGLLGNAFDGLMRPLNGPLRSRKWKFTATAKQGEIVKGGSILGTVNEAGPIVHKVMVPSDISGVIESIATDTYMDGEIVCAVRTLTGELAEISLRESRPIRIAGPFARRHLPSIPLCTGRRVIDTLFPLAKGGTAAVSGPFGSGKTVLLRQLAKWSDADVVVYISCGARGAETADLLNELSGLRDPRSGEPIINKTVIIASTADAPAPEREASVYTGVTIAEYYRDMGCDCVVIADSLTRWAEALRTVSSRLGEIPGEDGFPAYMQTHLARFYERAGAVDCCGGDGRHGSVTIAGSVSPPGGDCTEPVSQAAARLARVFWELGERLIHGRKFPAIDRLSSYSLYPDLLKPWYDANFGAEFLANRSAAAKLLREAQRLSDAAVFEGYESLTPRQKLTLETAEMISEDFLRQDAFAEHDCYSPYEKQATLLSLILYFNELCGEAIDKGVTDTARLFSIPARKKTALAKTTPPDEYEAALQTVAQELEQQIEEIVKEGGET